MSAPAYVALVGSEYVESADSLDALLVALAEVVDPTLPEDVAVWHGGRLVVVIHAGGAQTWLRPECRPAAPEAA